jgi:hypothetical protein
VEAATYDYDLGSDGPPPEVLAAINAAEVISMDEGEVRRCSRCGTHFVIHSDDRGYYYPTGRYSIKVSPKQVDSA